MPAEVTYNPYAFSVHDDPYVTYQQLRDEAPAWWNPELKFWVLSRMPDIDVDHERKVRFHSSNVTGWTSLPITFTPGVTK